MEQSKEASSIPQTTTLKQRMTRLSTMRMWLGQVRTFPQSISLRFSKNWKPCVGKCLNWSARLELVFHQMLAAEVLRVATMLSTRTLPVTGIILKKCSDYAGKSPNLSYDKPSAYGTVVAAGAIAVQGP
jgi:hypothetical protein